MNNQLLISASQNGWSVKQNAKFELVKVSEILRKFTETQRLTNPNLEWIVVT